MPRTRTSFSKSNPSPTAFKPGQSGNPSGRKPTVEGIQALARSHCPDAIQALADALKDPDRAVPAAIALLDRGIGKPAIAVWAQVDTTVTVGGIDAPPRETLEQWLERYRRNQAALDGPPQKYAQLPASPNSLPPARTGGEAAAPAVQTERAAESPGLTRGTAAQPRAFGSNAPNSAEPSTREMTEQEADWLRIRRRELGLLPDDEHPNPAWKR